MFIYSRLKISALFRSLLLSVNGRNGLTSYMLCYRGNRLVPLIPRLLLTYHDLRRGRKREREGGEREREHMCPSSKVEEGARPISLTLIDTKPARHTL